MAPPMIITRQIWCPVGASTSLCGILDKYSIGEISRQAVFQQKLSFFIKLFLGTLCAGHSQGSRSDMAGNA